jgi:hypothetical protein
MITPEEFLKIKEQQRLDQIAYLFEYIDSQLKQGKKIIDVRGSSIDIIQIVQKQYKKIGWNITYNQNYLMFNVPEKK